MALWTPQGVEQVPLSSETAWEGDPNAHLTDIEALGIDPSSYINIRQRDVIDVEAGVASVASEGFVACSGIIIKDHTTGGYILGHMQPGVRSFEEHMEGRYIDDGEAVLIVGDRSSPPNALYDIRANKYGSIKEKLITFEAGSTWWTAVFHVVSGEVLIARRKPDQSILRYWAFSSRSEA